MPIGRGGYIKPKPLDSPKKNTEILKDTIKKEYIDTKKIRKYIKF